MTLSAALADAYAYADRFSVILETVELFHPSWSQALRFVHDHRDLSATIEATAPRDAGAVVSFVATAFSVDQPPVDESGQAELTIRVDGVSGTVCRVVDASDWSQGAVEVIYRQFLHPTPDNAELVLGIAGRVEEMHCYSVAATLTSVEARCSYVDHANRRFPRRLFTRDLFPGLAP